MPTNSGKWRGQAWGCLVSPNTRSGLPTRGAGGATGVPTPTHYLAKYHCLWAACRWAVKGCPSLTGRLEKCSDLGTRYLGDAEQGVWWAGPGEGGQGHKHVFRKELAGSAQCQPRLAEMHVQMILPPQE